MSLAFARLVATARRCCVVLVVAMPLLLNAQFARPIYFDEAQDYDGFFKEGGSNNGIKHDAAGYVTLQGSPVGIAVYDRSATGGSNGSGGTSGERLDDEFDAVTVGARIGSSNNQDARFRAGYLLRLDGNDSNGYLVQVTSRIDGQSVTFEIFEGAGIAHSGIRIYRMDVPLNSITLEPDTFYPFEASLVGGSFTMDFAHGEATASFSDPSVSANIGQVGILLSAANSIVKVHLDDFSVNNPLLQEEITGSADYGSGTGQSFLLPPGETIRAVELHIEQGDGSVQVNLRKTNRRSGVLERAYPGPETSGVFLSDAVDGMPPGWFRIPLDTPYTNDSPEAEELVFDLELLTSGASGWNDYSFSNQNPYRNGSQVSWDDSSGEYLESATDDLAFRIITNSSEPPRFSYFDYKGGVAIVGYLGSSSNVVIPYQLDGKPVVYIHEEIFRDASVDIHTISIPESVEEIDAAAFALCCNQLSSITVSPDNPYFKSVDGVLFDKSLSYLVRCPDAKSDAYSIPTSVAVIGNDAFRYCAQLTFIVIPEGVTTIGDYAFYGCGNVTSLTLPSTLTQIGAAAFASTGLTSITIPAGVDRLPSKAFQNCVSLASVTIGSGVETMSSYVFSGCRSLESVTIPSSVTVIGASSFLNCTKLEAILFAGDSPDLVNTVFGNNAVGFGIYYPSTQSGYSGEDWNALPVYGYTGPSPETSYSRWLARQQQATDTSDESRIPTTNITYLLGYAFDLDLSQGVGEQMPLVEFSSGNMELTFFADREDLLYSAKASVDLVDWETVPVAVSDVNASGFRTATVDTSSYHRCYLKIEVTR